MLQDQLDALLKPFIREAVVLAPHRSLAAEAASTEAKFGGSPYAEEGDRWPHCPTCKNELVFVVQLRAGSDELLVFFYCFECFPWGLSDEEEGQWVIRRYPNPSTARLRVISPAGTQELTVGPCAVSGSPVKSLPDWEGLDSTCKEAADLCCAIDADSPWEEYDAALLRNGCLNDYATLVGGHARWVQGEAVNSCRQCGEQLRFVAQIDSEEPANLMWGDVGLVYIFQCPVHSDVFHLELQCH